MYTLILRLRDFWIMHVQWLCHRCHWCGAGRPTMRFGKEWMHDDCYREKKDLQWSHPTFVQIRRNPRRYWKRILFEWMMALIIIYGLAHIIAWRIMA